MLRGLCLFQFGGQIVGENFQILQRRDVFPRTGNDVRLLLAEARFLFGKALHLLFRRPFAPEGAAHKAAIGQHGRNAVRRFPMTEHGKRKDVPIRAVKIEGAGGKRFIMQKVLQRGKLCLLDQPEEAAGIARIGKGGKLVPDA